MMPEADGTASPIPPGELAGLREFELRVGAYAGQRQPERPERVELAGARGGVIAEV